MVSSQMARAWGANFRKLIMVRVDRWMRRGKKFGEREDTFYKSRFIVGKRIGQV